MKWTKFLHLEVGMPLLTPAEFSPQDNHTCKSISYFRDKIEIWMISNFTRKCNLWKSVLDQVPMLLQSCLPLHRGSFGIHR
ncbi:hypothetical protein CY35_04G135500 [Sphagnum magellanicum]|nr:hypothetical protein CY35_04G135500 [Sphagnum magellanicum]